MQDIIAKARVSEEILHLPTAGLTEDLSELVDLVVEDNDNNNQEEKSE